MTTHDRLLSILAERSARRGQFTLASGRQSTLYIDARLTTMSPDGLALIGPPASACASETSQAPLRAFTVRKEAKAHGTGRLVEGPFHEGDHDAVIEDVIT